MALDSTGSARSLRRWPGLPVFALGLFLAYVFCLFSNTISASAPRASLAFYTGLLIVCIIGIAVGERLRQLVDRPNVMLGCGVVAAVGTVAILVVPVLPAAAAPVAMYAGVALSAVGSGALALKALMLLGRLNVTSIWIWMAYIELVVVWLYFAIAASPPFVNVIVLTLLPLLTGGCVYLSYRPDSYFLQEDADEERVEVRPVTLAKFFLFVLLLAVTACFAKIISFMAIASDGTLIDLAWPAWERVGIALFILIAVVFLSKQFPFSQMCMFAVVMLIALIAGLALGFQEGVPFFFLSTLVHSTIECATLAFSACLIHRAKGGSFAIAGLALASLYGGSVVAYWADAIATPLFEENVVAIAFYGSAVLTILVSLVLFQERTFDALLGKVDEQTVLEGTAHPQVETPEQSTSSIEERLMAAFRDDMMLSPRECEVAMVMRSGKTVNRMAEDMHLSVYTVRGYIQNIYAKCGVHSKNEFLDLVERLRSGT